MTAIIAAMSLGCVVLLSCLMVIVGSRSRNPNALSVDSFLLPRGALRSRYIVSLLLSSSFGVNALLYAAWLGYSVGVWGLVIQLAWALSFLLLSPYSEKLRSTNSLHELLGTRFGRGTTLVASICTLVGFTYLMGWEFAIGTSSTSSILILSGGLGSTATQGITICLMVAVVAGTLIYTLWGGMRGNAKVDQFLNLIKILGVLFITILLVAKLSHVNRSQLISAIFPSFQIMRKDLGLFGLATNILFNLAWQFVDNSSWQSVIAGQSSQVDQAQNNLRVSGSVIFLTIGLLGTLFGISLVSSPNVTPDNILTQTISLLPQHQTILVVVMITLIGACMMSLFDVLFISSTFTLTKDIVLTRNAHRSIQSLTFVRLALLCIAVVATWGIRFLFQVTRINLFDFVYIVVITQLALFGPTVIALATGRSPRVPMWWAIICALVIGFGSAAIGTLLGKSFLVDGAGMFTLVASAGFAFLNSRSQEITS